MSYRLEGVYLPDIAEYIEVWLFSRKDALGRGLAGRFEVSRQPRIKPKYIESVVDVRLEILI